MTELDLELGSLFNPLWRHEAVLKANKSCGFIQNVPRRWAEPLPKFLAGQRLIVSYFAFFKCPS